MNIAVPNSAVTYISRVTPEELRGYLISLRKSLGFTQAKFADKLGMTRRGWQDIEVGASPARHIHLLAAERVALTEAGRQKNINLAPPLVRFDALDLAALIARGH